jgi:phenylpropionate dioxygenase-like ring-hydroxylating dioxygenase large terminal subunit
VDNAGNIAVDPNIATESAPRQTGTYPLNAWYAVAWDVEVRREFLTRTICGRPVLLYRTWDRKVVALEDACWHRLLPLSMGHLDGDKVVCGYHGMEFGPDGVCVHMPSQSVTPRRACVKAFPTAERYRLVWIWPGDPTLADPKLVPDLHWADDPEWVAEGSMLDMACDYRLVVDNLMDLTHEAFVHATSIGHAKINEAPFEVRHNGPFVELSRWMINTEAPPFLAMQLKLARGLSGAAVDRWQIIRFEPPATIVIDVGVAATGTNAPQGDRSQGVSGRVLNTITPSDEKHCYYFFAYARGFALDNHDLTAELKAGNIRIFTEDKAILEAQQHSLDQLSDRKLRNLAIDAGSAWARRAISAMIQAETPAPVTAKSAVVAT